MQAVAAAQGQAMRQARGMTGAPGNLPSQQPLSEGFTGVSRGGAAVLAATAAEVKLPELDPRTVERIWGKLPPQRVRDIMEGRAEKVPEQYRAMVETYFRVIAEKARRQAQ
jgi:hypothetical protein